MIVTAILILAAIACTVTGNLLLKIGSAKSGILDVWPFYLINRYTFIGALAFALGLLFYIAVLKKIPLNLAQSFFSVQFVFTVLASSLFLHEQISVTNWLGIAIVAIGLFIIGWSISS